MKMFNTYITDFEYSGIVIINAPNWDALGSLIFTSILGVVISVSLISYPLAILPLSILSLRQTIYLLFIYYLYTFLLLKNVLHNLIQFSFWQLASYLYMF